MINCLFKACISSFEGMNKKLSNIPQLLYPCEGRDSLITFETPDTIFKKTVYTVHIHNTVKTEKKS